MENLGNENGHMSVKPQILWAFVLDIVLFATGGECSTYLGAILNRLQQTCQSQVNKYSSNRVDYQNTLRKGCSEACTLIVQGSRGNAYPDALLMKTRVDFSLPFFDHMARFDDHTKSIDIGAELIQNLYTAFGKDVLKLVAARLSILEVFTKGWRFKTSKTNSLFCVQQINQGNWRTKVCLWPLEWCTRTSLDCAICQKTWD